MENKENKEATRVYHLSDNVVRNISVFLSRVPLSGAEVFAYNEIALSLIPLSTATDTPHPSTATPTTPSEEEKK
jgi:hypothetical protein